MDSSATANVMRTTLSASGGVDSTSYTTWSDTQYFTIPFNYSVLGQPITALEIDPDGSKSVFYRYRKSIKLTGVFGYSQTPPDDIKQAVKIQVMRWYMRSKQAWQDAGASVELGQMICVQQLDPDVKNLLAPYQIGNIVCAP